MFVCQTSSVFCLTCFSSSVLCTGLPLILWLEAYDPIWFHCVKSVQIRSFFWSVIFCIRTEYRDLHSKSPYSVQIQESKYQKKLRILTLLTQYSCTLVANICLDEDVLKTSWRGLSSFSSEDVLIKANIFPLLIRLQQRSSRRLSQGQYIRLGNTSSRRLQNVFKMSYKNVFKMSSRRLVKMSSKRFQDVFSSQTVLGNTISRRLRDIFKTFLRHTANTVIYRRFALVTLLINLWSVYKFPRVIKVSQI